MELLDLDCAGGSDAFESKDAWRAEPDSGDRGTWLAPARVYARLEAECPRPATRLDFVRP